MSSLADRAEATLAAQMSPSDVVYLNWQKRWIATARPKQLPPLVPWNELGVMAGRGFGKTRVGAEWLGSAAWEDPLHLPSAVIAPTYSDVKFTCFEGPAGLCNVIPHELIEQYNKSDLIIELRNGAIIRGFSAETYERLRGPQHARIWCDELAAWQYAQEAWDMAMFGLRLGPSPKVMWTTTPKPIELVRTLIKPKPGRIIVRGSTYENKANLPDAFFSQLEQYEGTTLGRQELDGELIDPEEAGIIRRSWLRLWPASKPLPQLKWIVMSLDTAFTEKTQDKKTHDPDYSACTVWGGFDVDGIGQILLLDCWQEHYGLPELVQRVRKELNVAYGDDQDAAVIKPVFGAVKPNTSGRKVDLVVIEDKGSGISLRQMLDREGVTAYAYNPGRADKLTRLHLASPVFARRQVWVPESDRNPGKPRTWAEPLIYQLCAFTGSGSLRHDDYVDSTTQAIRLFIDRNMLRPDKPKPPTIRDFTERPPVTNPYAA